MRIAGDLNRKSVTVEEASMPVLERIDKAEWLAENGSLKNAEKEIVIVETQIALIEERIRNAYSAIDAEEAATNATATANEKSNGD